MLTKLQITLSIVAGVAIVVFFMAIILNARVKSSEPVPDWQGLVVWASFVIIIACSLGVIVSQVLEFREPKEKKVEEPVAEGETPADELAAVGAKDGSESPAEEAPAGAGGLDAEPAMGGLQTEVATTDELASDFGEFPNDFADFEEQK